MELKKPIEITITGRQFFSTTDLFFSPERLCAEEGEIDFSLPEKNERSVELSTCGTLTQSDEGLAVTYDETEITGLSGCVTTFTLSDDLVCLSRAGEVKSHLVFEHGKRFQLYGGAGPFPINVQCHSLSTDMGENGGVIDIDYSVEVAGSTVEHNAYTIRVST
ncbi:MAG: DUF1934 domain-containing protein [Clostridia bacterium]|nr:DUF1934 domain-containing protein [Clostridia bacterium]